MRKRFLFFVALTIFVNVLSGQSLFEPNYALKRPHTLEIINIDLKEEVTLINLSIENLIEGGYFCIDQETYIITDIGERLKLTGVTGLPLCPDRYKFSRVGEIKYVTLRFPPIAEGTSWIDLTEECGDGCMAIYGIVLDQPLNAQINICFRDIDNGRTAEAIKKFEELRKRLKDEGNPILGSIYLNLLTLYEEAGESEKVMKLKAEFRGIIIPHKDLFIKVLN